MRLAVLIGAAALVVGAAAVALARADPAPAVEPGEGGKDRTGEGVPAGTPQPPLRE
ncbi:MAG: hypothetical protein OXI84_01025 [bacterium]|nr:hypothetical protein [bacterium]